MRVPISWLREYVEVEASTEEIAARLGISTCEVERIIVQGVAEENGNLGLFRVGRVVEAGKHPTADRLSALPRRRRRRRAAPDRLRRVELRSGGDRGGGSTWRRPAGRPGACRSQAAGETSSGMILSGERACSAATTRGSSCCRTAPSRARRSRTSSRSASRCWRSATTPNRLDLLSTYGFAREVAAIFGGEFRSTPGTDPERAGDEPVDIRIEDLERRPRYWSGGPSATSGSACRRRGQGTADRGDASDLERRRRHQLRDARTGQPAPRVRPVQAGRGAHRRSARAVRRGDQIAFDGTVRI